MAEQTILQELVKCIKNTLVEPPIEKTPTEPNGQGKSSKPQNPRILTIPNIIRFLLGEAIDDSDDLGDFDYSPKILSDSSAYNIYKDTRSLSEHQKYRLLDLPVSNWDIVNSYLFVPFSNDNKVISQLTDDIKALFEKYYNSPDLPLPYMIQSLVLKHFYGTDEEIFLFNDNDKSFHSNYVSWRVKEMELYELLKEHNLVFVTGLPASVKTLLVRYFSHSHDDWKNKFLLCTYTDLPLAERIKYIKFTDDDSSSADNPANSSAPLDDDEILNNLKDKTAFSLLTIDIPFMKEDDYAFIREHLADMKLKIIVTTKTTDIPDPYVSVNLDNRPVGNLLQIFKLYCPEKFIADEDFGKLCRVISYNPFIMVLVAKAYSKTFSIEKLLDIGTWHLDSNPKIHSSYHSSKKTALSIKKLATRILESYDTSFLSSIGSKLSILAKNEIPQAILENDVPLSDITKAIDLGLLQYTDSKEKIVQMPSIIADIIWQEYPIDYKDYKERIFHNLKKIADGQKLQHTYRFLYEHIITMVYRFHFEITKMKTRPPKESKETFIEWNQILGEIIQRFIRLGNISDAQNLLYRLYSYECSKELNLVPSCQVLDKEIFQLHIEFAKNSSPVETLEKAIGFLPKLKSHMEDSQKHPKILRHLLIKLYLFIMEVIDSLLLKQMISSANPEAIDMELLRNTLLSLYAILKNEFLIDMKIIYYYKMIFHYLLNMQKYSASDMCNAIDSF